MGEFLGHGRQLGLDGFEHGRNIGEGRGRIQRGLHFAKMRAQNGGNLMYGFGEKLRTFYRPYFGGLPNYSTDGTWDNLVFRWGHNGSKSHCHNGP